MKILLLAIRSLLRFRLYTLINILGLALSLACVIVICRYVYSEMTTDHFVPSHERVYMSVRHWEKGERAPLYLTTQNLMMQKDYQNPLDIPEIEKHSSFVSLIDVTIEANEKEFGAHLLATDSNFLPIMGYPVLKGEQSRLLTDPKDAILSESFAQKLFGSKDPMGQTLKYNGQLLTVKGITGSAPTKSSLNFDLLVSRELQWRWPPVNYYSIALADPHTDITKVNEQIKADYLQSKNKFLYQLHPWDNLYTETNIEKGEKRFLQGNANTIRILSVTALLLFLVGIFNFIHINSVVTRKRSKEFSMKKVFGAHPRQLFGQLYIENLFLTAIALFFCWVMIEITADLQIHLLRIEAITPPDFNVWLSVALLFLLPLITTLLLTEYRIKPVAITLQNAGQTKGRMQTRGLFLVIQYSISFCLIVSALFFVKQFYFMLNTDPGYRTEDIIKVWFQRPSSRMMFTDDDIKREKETNSYIRDAVRSSPSFSISCFGKSPYEFSLDYFSKKKVRTPGGEWIDAICVKVAHNYLSMYNIPVSYQSQSASTSEVLLNETAKKLFSKDGKAPVLLEIEGFSEENNFTVKGFTPDFQTVHLSHQNEPVILYIQPEEDFSPGKLMAAIVPGHHKQAIQFLKELHSKAGNGTFEYSFVEDEIQEIYEKDKQVAVIYSIFACIAILISSLGLFSLSLFDVQQRYREIAIRKVNGATTSVIMKMLLRKYYKLLTIAFCISVPIAWLALHRYLEGFAHKAPISWWLFAIALLITGGISLATLIWQIQKAARTNPADAIKTE